MYPEEGSIAETSVKTLLNSVKLTELADLSTRLLGLGSILSVSNKQHIFKIGERLYFLQQTLHVIARFYQPKANYKQ